MVQSEVIRRLYILLKVRQNSVNLKNAVDDGFALNFFNMAQLNLYPKFNEIWNHETSYLQ